MNETNTPLVSIRCITYNHEKYIRDALEGFVMQKTNFKFEAIVHDDASTDNTAAIIEEYAKKYPDIIKPIFETENQYSKKDGSLSRIMNAACKGKYIAMCEGDDYWTDPYKLQKQVDFLESHPDYSMCFHQVKIETEKEDLKQLYQNLEEREYNHNEILETWTVPTCSAMIKNEIFNNVPRDTRFIASDIILFLSATKYGRIYCLSDIMGVYRRSSSGMTLSYIKNINNYNRVISCYQAIKEYFPQTKETADKLICLNMLYAIRSIWKNNKMSCIFYTIKFIGEQKEKFLYTLLRWIKHLLKIKQKGTANN